MKPELPKFPYHRNPVESDSIYESNKLCECCNKSNGLLFKGVTYASDKPKNLCPWCIADGSAYKKYDASFFDAEFSDENLNYIELPENFYIDVFSKTIGFSTFNPFGWWVHCNEPAEYVKRNEPYEMVFECRKCKKQQIIEDLD